MIGTIRVLQKKKINVNIKVNEKSAQKLLNIKKKVKLI